MKQRQFKVELGNVIGGQFIPRKEALVWEFDDDCVDTNVWYKAIVAFDDDIEVGDIVRYSTDRTHYVMYCEDAIGRVLN